jgi:hypothetical protein
MQLTVLYSYCEDAELPEGPILSFLRPSEEDALSNVAGAVFYCGREEIDRIREQVRKRYIDIVARISSTPCKRRTLRQALACPGQGNPWWYHKVSQRDPGRDRTFDAMLHISTIIGIAEKHAINRIVFYGGNKEIKDVVSSKYQVHVVGSQQTLFYSNYVLRALASRVLQALRSLKDQIILFSMPRVKDSSCDVLFQGFWDWSVEHDVVNQCPKDHYFKSLITKITANGKKCGWLLWLDYKRKPQEYKRRLSDVLIPIRKHKEFILAQKYLRFRDIACAYLDMRPLVRYMRFSMHPEFREIFKYESLDYLPIFRKSLFYYFLNGMLPQFSLMETSYKRAFAGLKPRVGMTFLEFFPQARAFYEGGRRGCRESSFAAMQHASYGREKTLGIVDADREFNGHPDNIALPAPDVIFAMGELGKEIFTEDGFPESRIFLTGSSRYESLVKETTFNIENRNEVDPHDTNILLVTTLGFPLEWELVDAVSTACRGLPNVRIRLRSHPFEKIENQPCFKKYSHIIEPTSGPLDQDLMKADLLLFTYSTVAEEAYIRGIPVWQWIPLGFNGSVFRDIPVVPKLYNVNELRELLAVFTKNRGAFQVTMSNRDMVEKRCFYKADQSSSIRIADHLMCILSDRECITSRYGHHINRCI